MNSQDIINEMENRIEQALRKLVDRDQYSDVHEIRIMADAYLASIEVVKAIAEDLRTEPADQDAMIQRTERGKQARQYFIEVEKRHSQKRTGVAPTTRFTDSTDKELNHA